MPNPSRILIVDDLEPNRLVLQNLVLSLGHEWCSAENGITALSMIADTPPDLVLLDLHMPQMNGLEVLQELRKQDIIPTLPVIMISAEDEIELVAQCIECGADDYLVKPFNHTILRARIGTALERKRLQDREREYQELLERYNEKLEREVSTQLAAREQAQKQLLHAQKLETIGALTAGIGHDFNNILQSIMGNTSLALLQEDLSDHTREMLEEVDRSSERAAALTKRLLRSSRPSDDDLQPVGLNAVVDDVCRMLESALTANIKLEAQQDDNVQAIHGDPVQLQQVLMNLCINSRDAIKEHGTIRVSTADRLLSKPLEHATTQLPPGRYAELVVQDTGSGMDSETLEQVFEPFFTTKATDEGTGLGMSIVSGIVNTHRGALAIDSTLGEGTTIRLLFPVLESEMVTFTSVPDETPRGSESILFIDDDRFIRDIAQRTLKRLGYACETAENGADAIRLLKEDDMSFDLVVTDFFMPHLGGREFREYLAATNPGMPMILSSGYPMDDQELLQGFDIETPLLRKPYQPSDLARCVRAALDGAQTIQTG